MPRQLVPITMATMAHSFSGFNSAPRLTNTSVGACHAIGARLCGALVRERGLAELPFSR
jgi:hypothetical protein